MGDGARVEPALASRAATWRARLGRATRPCICVDSARRTVLASSSTGAACSTSAVRLLQRPCVREPQRSTGGRLLDRLGTHRRAVAVDDTPAGARRQSTPCRWRSRRNATSAARTATRSRESSAARQEMPRDRRGPSTSRRRAPRPARGSTSRSSAASRWSTARCCSGRPVMPPRSRRAARHRCTSPSPRMAPC